MNTALLDQPNPMSRISLRDLARLSGYSYFTASKVINGHGGVSDKARLRILDLAQKLRYRPNAAARSVFRDKTLQVGILLPNNRGNHFNNFSVMEVFVGINNQLANQGYILSLIGMEDLADDLHRGSRAFQEHLLDGMVIFGDVPTKTIESIRRLIPSCLYVDCNVWSEHSCIQRDEYHTGYTIASHLLAQGYRQLLWVGPIPTGSDHYRVSRRYSAVKDVASEAGMELQTVPRSDSQLQAHPTERFSKQVACFCETSDIAIVGYCTSDAMAWATVAMPMGYMPGRDYGLACCDDNRVFSEHWPELTRMSFNGLDMGTQAGSMFLQLLQEHGNPPTSQMLRGQLVVGDTSRATNESSHGSAMGGIKRSSLECVGAFKGVGYFTDKEDWV